MTRAPKIVANALEAGRPVSAGHFGAAVGISERAVRELGRRGIIPRTPDGLYPISASIRAYCAWMRDAAAGRGGTGAVAGVARERARLVREQADRIELANQLTRHELVPVAEVETEWSRIATGLRARLLAVPSRVHQRLAHLSASDVAVIDREVRDTLTELGTESASTPEKPVEKSLKAL